VAQVFSGLSINELSLCAPVPDGLGKYTSNSGLLLFIPKEGGSRIKGGAMEFEFSGGKINTASLFSYPPTGILNRICWIILKLAAVELILLFWQDCTNMSNVLV